MNANFESFTDKEVFGQAKEVKEVKEIREVREKTNAAKPTSAFVGISWAALFLGVGAYLIGLWNATMMLNEKGYYFTLLLFGLFASVSVQKTVRDRHEGIPTTNLYYGICWIAIIAALALMAVGLWNAELARSEKGFYAMSYVLSIFASVAVQKNVRDTLRFDLEE